MSVEDDLRQAVQDVEAASSHFLTGDAGHRIGILQSSALGFGVYRRLGFEQYSTYPLYVGLGQE